MQKYLCPPTKVPDLDTMTLVYYCFLSQQAGMSSAFIAAISTTPSHLTRPALWTDRLSTDKETVL